MSGLRLSGAFDWDFKSETNFGKKRSKWRILPDSGCHGCTVHFPEAKAKSVFGIRDASKPQLFHVFSRSGRPFLTSMIMAAMGTG